MIPAHTGWSVCMCAAWVSVCRMKARSQPHMSHRLAWLGLRCMPACLQVADEYDAPPAAPRPAPKPAVPVAAAPAARPVGQAAAAAADSDDEEEGELPSEEDV